MKIQFTACYIYSDKFVHVTWKTVSVFVAVSFLGCERVNNTIQNQN